MKYLALGVAALAATATATAPAHAQNSRVEAGMLTCDVSGGIGLILGSSKATECTFESSDGSITEIYTGRVTRFGLDIGVTGGARMVWVVLAPSTALEPGTLAGTYAGVSADASVGVGGGANVLVGGSGDTISLQPVSVQAQTGINVAAGISGMSLESPVAR